jgi:hypothetical protein
VSPSVGRVVVFGLMFDVPFAGIVAQFLHYLFGLRRLGWDVWYVEDSVSWPYDPARRSTAADPRASIARVARELDRHGFGERWIYRCAIPEVTSFGRSRVTLGELYKTADLALNVTGAQEVRDVHASVPHRVYVQSDPFGVQVAAENGSRRSLDQLSRHTAHFTFGELVGTPHCHLPTAGVQWRPTRQPVALELWPVQPAGDRFTTVTTWKNDKKHKVWNGEKYYWTKDREFLAVADLPRHTRATLELAIDRRPSQARMLAERGWRLVGGVGLGPELDLYRDYVIGSRGEFTVARDQVVRPRTGWFSDRSACYLAAGRPVVTQDTGFGHVLPTGEGLFAFRDVGDAAAALDEIEADHGRHSAAARRIAEEYFAAEKVLARLTEDVFSARATGSAPPGANGSGLYQRSDGGQEGLQVGERSEA